MAIEYFCCYHDYAKKIAKLSDQEVGRLFRALLDYSEHGETKELAGREAVAFDFIACDIDRAKEAYADKCRKMKANGSKRKQLVAIAPQEEEQEQEEEKEEEYIGGGGSCAGAPTFERVCAYAELMDAGRPFDPHFLYAGDLAGEFWRHYEREGWQIEGKPIRNWQALFKTWCDNAREKHRWEVSG